MVKARLRKMVETQDEDQGVVSLHPVLSSNERPLGTDEDVCSNHGAVAIRGTYTGWNTPFARTPLWRSFR